MLPSGFNNSFTSGELDDNAWDRVDLQPVDKGCEQANNLVIRIAGPLGKRRGLWLNGPISDQTHLARLIRFQKAAVDALVLEFGNLICHVWQTNGAPLLNGGVQVSFATPYTDVQLASLRYKQVGDVIYFRSSLGLEPQELVRTSNTSWAFNTPTFKNGPWLTENTDDSFTLTFTGTSVLDNNTTGAGIIEAGVAVTILASKALFTNAMIGTQFRIRPEGGAAGVVTWFPGEGTLVGQFRQFNGNVYTTTVYNGGGTNANSTTPPVVTDGTQSDGNAVFEYLHDGSGIVEITAVTDATHASGTVVSILPIPQAVATSYFSQGAYSSLNGWPMAWPEIREERLVDGATSANLDFADLTQTAGFSPTAEDFTPGTGTGVVVDTNGIRRRIGTDNGQILWFQTANYLVCGTDSGEYLIAGSVLDEPLSPSGITIKQLSAFGSADVYPCQAHKGLLFVCSSGQTLREIAVDNSQTASGQDHSFLAQHIAARGFAQLAWVKDPDNNCWIRLSDGGFCCFTYHQEQEVKGFTRQQVGGGMTVLDEIVMPGPGNLATLWVLASQTIGGVTQTFILMQSQPSDTLRMDAASLYEGAAANTLGGLAAFDGQSMDVLDVAGGNVWYPGLVVAGGEVTLPNGATTTEAQVGFTYPVYFKSLKLNPRVFNGALLQKQIIPSALVDMLTAGCTVAGDDGPGEYVDVRRATDFPGMTPHRVTREVTIVEQNDWPDQDRDPRIVIQELSPYDFVLYAIKPGDIIGE